MRRQIAPASIDASNLILRFTQFGRGPSAFGRSVPVTADTEQPKLAIKVAYETRSDSLVLLDRDSGEGGARQKSEAFDSRTDPEPFPT